MIFTCSPSGSALRLRVSDVQAPRQQTPTVAHLRHHQGRRVNRTGLPYQGVAMQLDWHELRVDEAVHRVCC